MEVLLDPPGLPVSFCVAPPADCRLVEVCHEDQGLRM